MYSIEVNSVIVPDEVISKILSYRNLEAGWDYGEGEGPNVLTIDRAISIYEQFLPLGLNVDVTPMTNGGITLIFYMGDTFVDIRINSDGTLDMRKEIGIGIHYEVPLQAEGVNIDTIAAMLNETFFQWNSLELSISKNMYEVKEDFKATVSELTGMEFPYLIESVQITSPEEFALI